MRSPQGSVGQRVADEVEALRGVGGPDGFLVLRTNKVRHGLTGVLKYFGGFHSKVVCAAVNGGVALLVVFLFSFDHAERVLRCSAGIEVDQGFAVDQLVQHREIIPDPQHLRVVHGMHGPLQ
ncbi:hypothetical protein D3C73_1228400 [compost metagenome]